MTSSWRPPAGRTPPSCDFFWGSHGCDLPYGHERFAEPAAPTHRCGSADEPCSWFDEDAPPDRRWSPAVFDGGAARPGPPRPWHDAGFRFAYWVGWASDSPNWASDRRPDRQPDHQSPRSEP